MGVREDRKRRALFELFSRQLEHVGDYPSGTFVCPMCAGTFTREALEDDSLCLAHIVPKELGGGSECTLTCKKCDNKSGAELESVLIEHLRYKDWSQGVGMWPARAVGEFGNVGVEFGRSGPSANWNIEVVPEISNPAHLSALGETMQRCAAGTDFEYKLHWSVRHKPHHFAAAVFHSAYLRLFHHFGYEFIAACPQYDNLRRQIFSPEEPVWSGLINVVSPSDLARTGQKSAVFFFREPVPCVGVWLRFKPKEGLERGMGVLLPAPDSDGEVPRIERGQFRSKTIVYQRERLARPHSFTSLWWQVQQMLEREAAREKGRDT